MITNSLVKRSITGSIFVLVLISAIFFHEYTFIALFSLISIVSIIEFHKLFREHIDLCSRVLTYIFCTIIMFTFIANKLVVTDYHKFSFYAFLAFVLIIANISFLIVNLFRKDSIRLRAPQTAMFSLLYAYMPFILFMDIPFISNHYNPYLIFYIILLIWINDTGAYIVGRIIGKKPLFKSVSPNKTLEGFIGGIIITLLTAFYVSRLLNKELEIIGKFAWVYIGFIVSTFGPIGDLIESKIKRSLNIKDSGNILPGHGGLLDRFDALLIVAPIIKIYLIFIF